MAYRLMFDCEQLQTPLLVSPVALIKLHRRARSWVAWTEFGSVGEGRRVILRKSDKFSQIPSHPGLDPATYRRRYGYGDESVIKGRFS